MKIEGFRKMCKSPGGQADLDQMMSTMRAGVDNLSTLVVDQVDDYVERTRTFGGVDSVIAHHVEAVVRDSSIPRTILLGQQAGGLANSAEGEFRSWYDHVSAAQQEVLLPGISRVVDLLLTARANRGEGAPPEDWEIQFDPLWQPSPTEQATAEKTRAEAAEIRVRTDVSAPDEEREKMVRDGDIIALEGYDDERSAREIEGPPDVPTGDPSGAPEFDPAESDDDDPAPTI